MQRKFHWNNFYHLSYPDIFNFLGQNFGDDFKIGIKIGCKRKESRIFNLKKKYSNSSLLTGLKIHKKSCYAREKSQILLLILEMPMTMIANTMMSHLRIVIPFTWSNGAKWDWFLEVATVRATKTRRKGAPPTTFPRVIFEV